ncbi:MAG TPA: thioredoxin family protein [Nitrososphaeraceae archaeon]
MDYLQSNQFDRLLSEGKKTLIMFYADWCPFCQRFKPSFESYTNSSIYDIDFYACMINDDDNPLWDRFSINTVPTLIAFYKGNIISRRDSRMGFGLDKSDVDSILREIS